MVTAQHKLPISLKWWKPLCLGKTIKPDNSFTNWSWQNHVGMKQTKSIQLLSVCLLTEVIITAHASAIVFYFKDLWILKDISDLRTSVNTFEN